MPGAVAVLGTAEDAVDAESGCIEQLRVGRRGELDERTYVNVVQLLEER